MTVVLLVSSGAAWEPRALSALNDHPGTVLLKRCVDVADLLAAARTGQAEVAVLPADLPGLDQNVVDDLQQHGVRVVGMAADPELAQPRAARIGVVTVVADDRAAELGELVVALPAHPAGSAVATPSAPTGEASAPTAERGPVGQQPPGRVVAVWGAGGAPGRTTLACGLAGELARRGLTTLLVDADPHGGAVAQQLGILDEVSGLLSAARLAGAGTLDQRFASVQRRVSDHLRVLTGLPRPDRWVELRPGLLTAIVDRARQDGQVVLDTGFSLEPDLGELAGRAERNGLTREAVQLADELVLVGSADPVGLARLARAIVDLHELVPDARVRVVVNRMRPTLGWREADVRAMLAGFGPPREVHFLPEDQAAVDRAVVAGRLLVETGDGALTRALGRVLDAMAEAPALRR
ncbi:CpaE family protein [Nocardioides sp. R1-1]|uniref:AAA family ATPase n=1 Tax=Nocardioides sp. R1-1 TaxID=3383502 RepID=UPI0038D0EA73